MTPEAQRIAIAEACGWEYDQKYAYEYGGWKPPGGEFNACIGPPDYLNDLNAMHEAEGILTVVQYDTYRKWLADITGSAILAIFATSSQRAEAFLRTIGKWKD